MVMVLLRGQLGCFLFSISMLALSPRSHTSSIVWRSENGLSPWLKISQIVIPKEYTSDSIVSLERFVHLSNATHGSLKMINVVIIAQNDECNT